MKTEKHCQRHGPASDPYCVNCHKDHLAKEKADDRLALTACSRSFSALVDLLMAINRYGDGASMMHPRLTMAIGAARKAVDEILNEQPERESETSTQDECARSPSYHGNTRCAKCNEVHWMHGDCKSSENADVEAAPPLTPKTMLNDKSPTELETVAQQETGGNCVSLLVRIPEEFALRAINALSYRYNRVMDDPNTHGKDGLAKLLREGAESDKRAMAVISAAISDANEKSPSVGATE